MIYKTVVYGDWGLGIGDWAQSPIPNPQSPIPNPQFFIKYNNLYMFINIFNFISLAIISFSFFI